MKIDITLEHETERVNNFTLADAIYNLCGDFPGLDTKVLGELLVSQGMADILSRSYRANKLEEKNNGYPLR